MPTTPSTAAALLSAQAQGGIDGVNAYVQEQQLLSQRKQEAVAAALAAATKRGAPQVALDATAAQVAKPYETAELVNSQQATNYDADMARRTSRWNEYAHNVESARGLVADQAAGKASVIDAQTRAQLALLEAQRRATSSRSSGGGGGGSTQKALTKAELASYLGSTAANKLATKAQLSADEAREVARKGEQSRAMAGAALARSLPAADPRTLAQQIDTKVTKPNQARQRSLDAAEAIRQAALFADQQHGLRTDQVPWSYRGGKDFYELQSMDQAELRQIANRVGAGAPAGAKLTEEQVRLGYEQQRKSSVPGYAKQEAAYKALQQAIAAGNKKAGETASTATANLTNPSALTNEMANVAVSDPALAGRFSPFDLAEVLTPGPSTGESAADYLTRLNGWGPNGPQTQAYQAQQKAGAAQDEAAVASQKQSLNYQFGIDIDKIASKAGMPWETAATILTQDPTVADAITYYEQSRASAGSKSDLETVTWQITQQLNAQQRAVFMAYIGG